MTANMDVAFCVRPGTVGPARVYFVVEIDRATKEALCIMAGHKREREARRYADRLTRTFCKKSKETR